MRGRRVLMAGVVVVVLAVAVAGVGRSLGWFGGSAAGCEDGPHQEVAPPSAGDAPEVDLPASAGCMPPSARPGSPARSPRTAARWAGRS